MAEKKKDSTPPPLLLMPPSGGLTLTPASGTSLLMPVPQSEASLLSPVGSKSSNKSLDNEEEGEADSFLGQTPPSQAPSSTFPFFQASDSSAMASDPFSQVRQPDPGHVPVSQPPLFSMAPPTSGSATPPRSQATPPPAMPTPTRGPPVSAQHNKYRISGAPRYAVPPTSMYGQGGAGPGAPPTMMMTGHPATTMTGMPPPPTTTGPPPMQPAGLPPMDLPPADFISMHTGPPPPGGGISPPQGAPLSNYQSGDAMMQGSYMPLQYHWFYCKNIELRQMWYPFTVVDSIKLEESFRSGYQDNLVISVEGGRYDVDIIERTRNSIYWEELETKVRRCSWFYKPEGDTRFVPYEEDFAEKLEEEYRNAIQNNIWHKRLEFPGGETIVMHNPNVIVHFRPSAQPDEWGNSQGEQSRPRVVKRGIDEFDDIDDGEPTNIDHLVFVIHGIGSTCDLRFRNIVECVDDFRALSIQMLKSHFTQYQEEGRIGRVEFLPVRWHAALHSDATGIDRRLKAITLNSIGKLRHFTNDTLLDILLYASPAYSQKIADTVGVEINRLYQLFCNRNPGFRGGTSVAGHSLGSLILFDLLSHQKDPNDPDTESEVATDGQDAHLTPTLSRENTPSQDDSASDITQEETEKEESDDVRSLEQLLARLGLSEYVEAFKKEQVDMEALMMLEESDIKEMGVPMGPRKKIRGYLKLQKHRQNKKKEESERRIRVETERKMQEEAQRLAQQAAQQQQQRQATKDPLLRQASSTSVSYVVSGAGTGLPFVKYPQLDFSPVHFYALGSPVAMFMTVRGTEILGEEFRLPTCSGFFNIFHPFDPVAYRLEPLITPHYPPKPVLMPHHKGRKRMHLELKESLARMGTDIKQRIIDSVKVTWKTINDFALAHRTAPQEVMEQEVDNVISSMAQEEDEKYETGSITSSMHDEDILVGQLNQGRRIDYVLQEKPIESFNDYLFALGSHACYWESEDTVLMILKEIYALMGVAPVRPGVKTSPMANIAPPPMAGSPGSLPPPTMGQPMMYSPDTAMGGPPPGGMMPHGMASPPGGMPPLPTSFAPPLAAMAPPPGGIASPPGGIASPPGGMSTAAGSNVGPPPLAGFRR